MKSSMVARFPMAVLVRAGRHCHRGPERLRCITTAAQRTTGSHWINDTNTGRPQQPAQRYSQRITTASQTTVHRSDRQFGERSSASECSARRVVGQRVASPRNTTMERPSLARSSSDNWPIRSPSLERGMVVILSTISRLGCRIPVVASASTGIRNSGASVSSVVNAQIVTDAVASKRSSWTMTTGRGLPT